MVAGIGKYNGTRRIKTPYQSNFPIELVFVNCFFGTISKRKEWLVFNLPGEYSFVGFVPVHHLLHHAKSFFFTFFSWQFLCPVWHSTFGPPWKFKTNCQKCLAPSFLQLIQLPVPRFKI